MLHPKSPTLIGARAFRRPARSAAFSLIELVMVVALISAMAGVGSSVLRSFGGQGGLSAGARTVAGMLSVARSEAIARHTLVRFAVEMPAANEDGAGLRRVSLWAWDPAAEIFVPISKWEELPVGIAFEPQLPDYLRDAAYATADASTIQGDCVLAADFEQNSESLFAKETGVKARFIDFLPSGNVRIPGGSARQAIFVLTEGYLGRKADAGLTYTSRTNGQPNNWTQINVNSLTGRVRLYQP